MKSEKNILIAFVLNLIFSLFEFLGGAITGSVAIMSDAVHDVGDAISIGVSYFLEKKSKKQPDDTYTYGYTGYSVLGSLITTVVLMIGSGAVIYNAIVRLFNPIKINYEGMIIFAVAGTIINGLAAWFTSRGESLNQRSVNLHMLEDVLGWIVVLIGAVVMHFTDISIIDPLMSLGVSVFIMINALRNLVRIVNLFLVKMPDGIDISEIKKHVTSIDGVSDVHHIHIWSMDGYRNFATMHVVCDGNSSELKSKIRDELAEHDIYHATLELELEGEDCADVHCHIEHNEHTSHHHHHHHHH